MKKIVSIFLMFVMMVTNITFAPISVGAAEVSGNGYEEISISEIADDSVSATAADVIDGVEILPEQSIGVEEPLVSADSVTTKVAFSGPMVSVGNGFTVELRNDKTVWVTGDNQFGVLGDGRDAGGYSTMPVKATIENVVYISAGYSFILAVDEDGEVWAWGLNST
ncbi:MAG: hypothetical protein LBV33_01855, partial [Lachnospiraceae bacterium]|nr:hypothetical protein [Lachnospiraceae bacterium]